MPSALIPTTSDLSTIADLGSDAGIIKTVTSLSGGGTDTFANLPIRNSFELVPAFSENKVTTDGQQEITKSSKETWSLKFTTSQIDEATLKTFWSSTRGKLLQIVLELNNQVAGTKYWYAGMICKLIKHSGFKSRAEIDFEFELYKAAAAISITLDNATFTTAAATFSSTTLTIAKGDYVGIVSV